MALSSDQILQCPPPIPQPMTMDRRWKANIEPAPNCPRCASPNTKFCYYNNYSLSQPRYFCKGCRRYWTKGGSLRNVPVGGGCRKSRRSRSTKTSFLHGSRDGGSGPHSSSSPNSSSSASSDHESGGPNIDLAAVFAKFLSHDQINEEVNEGITTPSEASHDSLTTSSSCGLEKLSDNDVLDDQEFQVMEELVIVPSADHTKQLHQEQEAIQGFISPDLAPFDDIMTDDVFWSDTSDLSSLTWQPVAQSQEFDSTNLFTSDNWSYFDTTGFEVFPRP